MCAYHTLWRAAPQLRGIRDEMHVLAAQAGPSPLTTFSGFRYTQHMWGTQPAAPAWIRRVGIINDYVRIPYANGSSFASQLLFRELTSRGRDVAVVGPRPSKGSIGAEPPEHISMWSLPLRNHPGVNLPLPKRGDLRALGAAEFDLLVSHSCSALQYAGVWMRQVHDVPLVSVNTVHLPSVYNTLLPDALVGVAPVHALFDRALIPWVEGHTAHIYNESDALVVLSDGMADYWRGLGVDVPIAVIGRAVDPRVFDVAADEDPFDPRAPRGGRLLIVCRHVREKAVSELLATFARHIAPKRPNATLTLVGDGPDHDTFRTQAEELGISGRCFFTGERVQTEMPAWYRHADLFVYMSMSETYGQVVGEALWCGLPVVAYDDGRGVCAQVTSGVDGELVPVPTLAEARAGDERFGAAVVAMLEDDQRRAAAGERARERARGRAHPDRVIGRYFEVFEEAREHNRARPRLSSRARLGQGLSTLARWTSVHAVTLTTGLMRAPATVNRHGVVPPPWDLRQDAAEADELPQATA